MTEAGSISGTGLTTAGETETLCERKLKSTPAVSALPAASVNPSPQQPAPRPKFDVPVLAARN